jgi:hypothetical protein
MTGKGKKRFDPVLLTAVWMRILHLGGLARGGLEGLPQGHGLAAVLLCPMTWWGLGATELLTLTGRFATLLLLCCDSRLQWIALLLPSGTT